MTGAARGELLEVVEHEEDAEAEEVGDEGVERVEVDGLGQAERGGHPGDHQARFAHGGEVDGHGTSGEGRRLVPEDGHREPRLAHPTGTSHGDEPVTAGPHEGAELLDVGVATDERRRRHGGGAGNGRPAARRQAPRRPGPMPWSWPQPLRREATDAAASVGCVVSGGFGAAAEGLEAADAGTGRVLHEARHGIPRRDRGDERRPVGLVQVERVGDRPDGVRVGTTAFAALEGPIALPVRPARSASSSWVSDRASRRRRSTTAKLPGAASASTGQTLAAPV